MKHAENGSAKLVAGDRVRPDRVRPDRAVKHVAVKVSPQAAALVRVAQQRLNDLTAFAAASGGVDEKARYIGMQGEKLIFEVVDNGNAE